MTCTLLLPNKKSKWISTKQHFSLDCPLVWILPFIFVFFPFQVLDAKFREPFTNVNRWFTTLVNQPQFKKVVGDFKFCDKMAEFDGNVTWGFFTFSIHGAYGWNFHKGWQSKVAIIPLLLNFHWSKTALNTNLWNSSLDVMHVLIVETSSSLKKKIKCFKKVCIESINFICCWEISQS